MKTNQSKHQTPSASQKIVRRMLAIIPILVIAVLCYSVSVFAWFQATLVNEGNRIEAGSYAAEIRIYDGDTERWASGRLGSDRYGQAIPLPDISGDVQLVVSSSSDSTVDFQYQLVLFTESGEILRVPGSPENKQVLEPGKSTDKIAVHIPDGQTVQLKFEAAFKSNTMLPLAAAEP